MFVNILYTYFVKKYCNHLISFSECSFFNIILFCVKFHAPSILAVGEIGTTTKSQQMVNVGVILDLDTPVGKMAHHCVSMALSDFYARNANRTKLNLTVKDSRNDVVSASSAGIITLI
jgi:ionotropic glutamate receptor